MQLDHAYDTDKKTLLQENEKLRKRIKKLNQKLHRQNRKIENIEQLLHILKAKNLVASEQHLLLRENFGNMAREIFENQIKAAKKKNRHSHCYSDEMKQFALTLHYYSPKACDFVRKILALPHPSSIRAWGASVDCSPGFLTNVINMLGSAVEENPWMSEVVLVVDAMALHKSAIWDPVAQQYVGSVNYGTAIPEPPEDLVIEALVFMVVGLTGHFKHPIAYFLQNKCTAHVQGQLIKDGISLLHGAGLNVLAVVFDGCPTNQSTAKVLGCQMKVSHIKPWFPHPKLPASKVYVIFDVCHMIKLIRNLLGDYRIILNETEHSTERIDWKYIEQLNNVQEDIGFTFANRLKKKHIMWRKHKKNVSLAAQTLSSSVAHTIDFLQDDVALPSFADSKPTVDFIKKVDEVFDLLNSRNPHAKGNKAPITLDNLTQFQERCQVLSKYLFDLKNEKGNLLRGLQRKTPIWGLALSIQSITSIVTEMLTRSHRSYKYVPTYSFSQDHIELLFSKIRRHCGWNNNPNVLQFKYALRQMLI